MGLEMVELGIIVEEQFGVTIEIADYERLKTVRDLERHVSWKLGQRGTGSWPDDDIALVRGFCEIRREIMRQTGIPRSQLRPSTRLVEHWHTQAAWKSVSRSLGAVLAVPLPTWRIEGWMIGGCLAALVSPLIAIGLLAIGLDGLLVMTGVTALTLLCWAAGAALAVKESSDRFRSSNLAGVARQSCYPLSRLRGIDFPAGPIDRSRGGDVKTRLVAIVSEIASVPKDEIRPDSRFYEDLKMG